MSRVRKSVTAGATQVMYRIAVSLGLELRSPTSNENTEIHDWPSFEKRQRRSFDDFKPGRIEGRCLFADAGSRSRGDLPTDKYCCRSGSDCCFWSDAHKICRVPHAKATRKG
jgi:hypothetical protein